MNPSTFKILFGVGLTAQTKAFVAAVGAAGGTITGTQARALDRTLVRPLLSSGLWNSMTALYPFIGGSAAAHSINLITPGTYSITWFGTVTHNANGITGNGGTGYGATGIVPSVNIGTSGHLSIYNRTGTLTAGKVFAGSVNTSGITKGLQIGNSNASDTLNARINTDPIATIAASPLTGFVVASSTGAASQYLRRYYQGATLNTNTTQGDRVADLQLYILTLNVNGSPFGTTYTTANLGLMSAGTYLSQAQADQLGGIVEAYQSALGRKV